MKDDEAALHQRRGSAEDTSMVNKPGCTSCLIPFVADIHAQIDQLNFVKSSVTMSNGGASVAGGDVKVMSQVASAQKIPQDGDALVSSNPRGCQRRHRLMVKRVCSART